MHRLDGTYAQAFNRRHDLDGHLFEDRFHAARIESEWHFFAALRSISLNPLRAGICTHPAEYRWSSYRATVGLDPAPGFLAVDAVLAHFGSDRVRSRSGFAALVCEALPPKLALAV